MATRAPHCVIRKNRRSRLHLIPACLALILLALGVLEPSTADAQSDAAEPANAPWQLEPVADGQPKPDSISLRVAAIGNAGASLSLRCRPEGPLYEFIL